jgi:cytochrome c biogenesis protein CcdA
MKNFFARIQGIIQPLVRGVQRVLLVVFLTILYFLGFGITLLFLMLFNRRALIRKYNLDATFWNKAEGYDADIDNSVRQS